MKLIQEISIWDNGVIKKGSILNTYAINLLPNQSATFYYSINSINENGSYGQMLAQGNILMTGKDYENWEEDNYVWQFIAKSLNLVIVGDYVDPVAEQPIQETVIVEPVSEIVSEEAIIESVLEEVIEPTIEVEPIIEQQIIEEL